MGLHDTNLSYSPFMNGYDLIMSLLHSLPVWNLKTRSSTDPLPMVICSVDNIRRTSNKVSPFFQKKSLLWECIKFSYYNITKYFL